MNFESKQTSFPELDMIAYFLHYWSTPYFPYCLGSITEDLERANLVDFNAKIHCSAFLHQYQFYMSAHRLKPCQTV
ncbi:hypothetical protein XELAEV_18001709mg [Xenopus laevis]|nr:hypothetical protein XELAEV_18001709mg [Xenopus laevis]